MTRASKSDLVLDGNEVKLRLKAERLKTRTPVHVDWVRFTCNLRNAPFPSVETLFPLNQDVEPVAALELDGMRERTRKLALILRELPDADFTASAQAKTLADEVSEALGAEFSVFPELRKGHDFYRFRWSIVRHGVECAWVGFLSSGDSPRQSAQAKTLHVNVYGSACTFAEPGFNDRLAALIDRTDAKLTRIDLALDFFDGLSGGIDRVRSDYIAGLMDHYGRRPSCNMVGDWCNGRSRSFYFGSKEAGKQTNVYEKGHQLYGAQSGSEWHRVELRYGNKLRDLPSDMLRRPADFFAGASDWHAAILREVRPETSFTPEPCKTRSRLASETVQAEVARVVRWARNTAGPSLAFLVKFASFDQLASVCENQKLPGRLQRFGLDELDAVAARYLKKLSASGFGRVGLQAA